MGYCQCKVMTIYENDNFSEKLTLSPKFTYKHCGTSLTAKAVVIFTEKVYLVSALLLCGSTHFIVITFLFKFSNIFLRKYCTAVWKFSL